MTYLDDLRQDLRSYDDGRARSQQTEIGISSLRDCRAALGFELDGEWETDDPDNWRALAGTFLLEEGRRVRSELYRDDLHFEQLVTYRGRPGHVDEVRVADDDQPGEVTDWKFPSLAASLTWHNDSEALDDKRTQVHTYAAALIEEGMIREGATVRILVAPVDGRFTDWWAWEEPFDRAVADAAIDRYLDVVRMREGGIRPPREKPWAWCEQFCGHFTRCRGGQDPDPDEVIVDAELAAMVERYGLLGEQIAPLHKEREKIKPEIRGLHGVARGWTVKLTRPRGMKDTPDMDAIRAHFSNQGLEMPTVEVPTSTPSLSVRRAKSDKRQDHQEGEAA
ncbi:MAG: hypothetical protein ACRD0W_04725 [Acidimicrobiales bacterium]